MAGLFNCMDGFSLPISFVSRSGVSPILYSYESTGTTSFGGRKYQKVTACNGLAYYRLTNCSGAPQYDCDNDVYVYVGLNIECGIGGGRILGAFVSWITQAKDLFNPCLFVDSNSNGLQTDFTCPINPVNKIINFNGYFGTCVLRGSMPQAGIVYGNQADGAFTLSLTE